jgi:hypothetical protein
MEPPMKVSRAGTSLKNIHTQSGDIGTSLAASKLAWAEGNLRAPMA